MITVLCLQYLTFECFDSEMTPDTRLHSLEQGYYAFTDYAVTHWSDHYWAACHPEQPDHAAMASLAFQGNEQYGEAIREFNEHHDILQGEESPGMFSLPDGCSLPKAPSCYKQMCSLLDYTRRRKARGLDCLDEIAPLTVKPAVAAYRLILEQLGASESTNAVANHSLRSLYGAYWYKCPKATCFHFHEGFADVKARNDHIARHEKPFRCDCSSSELFAFTTKKELDKHMLVYHPQHGQFAVTFARISKAQKKHKVKDDDAASNITKHPTRFACPRFGCDSKFTRNATLKSHLKAHDAEKTCKCPHPGCNSAFVRQNDLRRHVQSLHSGKQHFCGGPLEVYFSDSNVKAWGCNRTFARADHLAAHLRTEAGKKCIKPLLEEKALLAEWKKRPRQEEGEYELTDDFINSIIDYQASHGIVNAELETMDERDQNGMASSSLGTLSGSSPQSSNS
jgi:hypothetical protein